MFELLVSVLLFVHPLQRGGWLFYLVLAAALSFSAFFELIEWWAALVWGGDADAFLRTTPGMPMTALGNVQDIGVIAVRGPCPECRSRFAG